MSTGLTINGQNESINDNISFNTYLTYSWINNAMFYPIIPKQYYDYYNRFVRQYFYWYDGFNPQFHSQSSGIFSTRLAYTLCNKMSGLINGGTLMFDDPKELSNKRIYFSPRDKEPLDALQFIQKWSETVNLTNKNNTAVEYSLAGGDSVYKLNSDGTDVYPTVLRKDNYVVDVDFKGDVTAFTGVVYAYTKMRKDDSGRNDYYYLLEDREYQDGVPKYRIYVKVGYGNLTTNKDINFDKIQEVKWEELSKDIRKAIKDNYGNIRLDTWYDLPMETIGIYLMKASDGISFLPQLPFGESMLSNIIAYLQSFDYYFSAINTDFYIGRGRVLLPDFMENPHKEGGASHFEGLDSGVYQRIKYANIDDQKIVPFQFDIRSDDWEKAGKTILRFIAMALQVSDRTLANFLTDGSERATAREISVDDATSTFVENKRSLYQKPINCMLRDVLDFYGFDEDEIRVRFSRVGLNNMNDVVQQMTTLIQNGLVDRKTAVERIFADMNDRQIDEMVTSIEEQLEKQMQQKEAKQAGTSDEDYEQQNNRDINHIEKGEE